MMNKDIKVATLNLCLGLKHKKLMIEHMLNENRIDILCLQEVDIENGYEHDLLKIKGYAFEQEVNSIKSRAGKYDMKHSSIEVN